MNTHHLFSALFSKQKKQAHKAPEEEKEDA
jgi:hypothetical protein